MSRKFKAFDTSKIDEYAKTAKEQWGKTAEYKEFADNSSKVFYDVIPVTS